MATLFKINWILCVLVILSTVAARPQNKEKQLFHSSTPGESSIKATSTPISTSVYKSKNDAITSFSSSSIYSVYETSSIVASATQIDSLTSNGKLKLTNSLSEAISFNSSRKTTSITATIGNNMVVTSSYSDKLKSTVSKEGSQSSRHQIYSTKAILPASVSVLTTGLDWTPSPSYASQITASATILSATDTNTSVVADSTTALPSTVSSMRNSETSLTSFHLSTVIYPNNDGQTSILSEKLKEPMITSTWSQVLTTPHLPSLSTHSRQDIASDLLSHISTSALLLSSSSIVEYSSTELSSSVTLTTAANQNFTLTESNNTSVDTLVTQSSATSRPYLATTATSSTLTSVSSKPTTGSRPTTKSTPTSQPTTETKSTTKPLTEAKSATKPTTESKSTTNIKTTTKSIPTSKSKSTTASRPTIEGTRNPYDNSTSTLEGSGKHFLNDMFISSVFGIFCLVVALGMFAYVWKCRNRRARRRTTRLRGNNVDLDRVLLLSNERNTED